MTLLAPWALGLAILAAVPALLHLLRWERRRRVEFPAIRYLERARERSARAVRIRDRLLLASRVAIVLAIAGAAAGPLVGRGGAADHAPTDVALVVDNSGSMKRVVGDSTLLDVQRARASRLLDVAHAADRFWVVPTTGPAPASEASATDARLALGEIEPTDAAADLGIAVRTALRLLPPGDARPAEVVVFSDFQQTSLPASPVPLPERVRLVLSWVAGEPDNGAILDVAAEPPLGNVDGSLLARVSPPAEAADPEIELRLAIDGETASIARVDESGTAVLRLPAAPRGEHSITVEAPASGLRSDDRRHFVLRVADPPVVGHAGPAGSYVALALRTLAAAGRLRFADSGERQRARVVEGARFEGAGGPAPEAWILIPPDAPDRIGPFNAALARLSVPWRLELTGASGSTSPRPGEGVPGLDRIRLRGDYRLERVGVGRDTVLVRTTEGSPWVVSGRTATGDYVLVASPLDPRFTELPVDAAMVPFLDALLFRWTGLGSALEEPTPAGFPVRLPADADSVRGPDGRVARVDGRSPYVPTEAGVYEVFRAGGGGPSLLASSVPARESALEEADPEAAAASLGSVDAVIARGEAEFDRTTFGTRRGRALLPVLVALVGLLAVVEGALATRGGLRRGVRGDPGGEATS